MSLKGILLAGLLLILFVFTLAWLWPDEKLRLDVTPGPAANGVSEHNFHLGVFGFLVPENQDPFAFGRVALAAHALSAREDVLKPQPELAIQGEIFRDQPDGCRLSELDCASELARHLPDFTALLAPNQTLIERYRSFYSLTDFRNAMRPRFDSPVPAFGPILDTQRLVQIRILAQAGVGDFAGAYQALADDMRFWRRALGGTDVLITKMVSVRSIEFDLRLYAYLLSQSAMLEPLRLQALPTIDGLSQAERSNLLPLQNELQLWVRTISDLDDEAADSFPFLLRLAPLKPNTTINYFLDAAGPSLRRSLLPADRYHREVSMADQAIGAGSLWHYLVNGRGLWIYHIGQPSYQGYGYRVHDLEVLIRLVNLKQQILRNPNLDPQSTIDANQAIWSNPYLPDEPARWDAVAGTISYEHLPGAAQLSRLKAAVRLEPVRRDPNTTVEGDLREAP